MPVPRCGFFRIEVAGDNPVVLVVGLFGIVLHESAGGAGGADDLHKFGVQGLQHAGAVVNDDGVHP